MPAKNNDPMSGASFDDNLEDANLGTIASDRDAEPDLTGAPASRALAAYSAEPVFDRNEIVMPRLRIAQGLTAEVQDGSAHPGQILLSGFEPLDSAILVPLRFARLRELRGEGEERNTVLCTSSDAVVGVGDPGGVCADCPMNEWSEKTSRGKTSRVPPKCTFIFSYMVYVHEHNQMAVIEFRRTSERIGRLLNTMVAQRGLANFAFKLGSEVKREGQRTYAVPTIAPAPADTSILTAARMILGA